MAKKKVKFPVPKSDQIWRDALVLLQYAHSLEKDGTALDSDDAARLMLSEIHHAVEGLRKTRRVEASHGLEAGMVERLAKVYERVVRGDLAEEDSYREAIMRDVGGMAEEGENPNNPDLVPGFLLMTKKTITTEGGPLEAAAKSSAEFYDRGARQLMEYRSRISQGTLIVQPLEAVGYYHVQLDFLESVMTKVLCICPELVVEIIEVLKEKNWRKIKFF